MLRFVFHAEMDHEITGELGWADSRMKPNGPYSPLTYTPGIIHDCLEHFALGTVSDEIEAHGAMYWGRYLGGYTTSRGFSLNQDSFGNEWINLARAMVDHELMPPKRTARLDDSVEEDITEIVAYGQRAVISEFMGWQDGVGLRLANELTDKFPGWFRTGYRRAAKRWTRLGFTPCELAYLFRKAEETLERIRQPEGEWERLVITFSRENGCRAWTEEVSYSE